MMNDYAQDFLRLFPKGVIGANVGKKLRKSIGILLRSSMKLCIGFSGNIFPELS